MIRVRRSNTFRSCVLGVCLTLVVVLLDGAGALDPLERPLYDARAAHFQHFTPPPTDRLVHLDIDDATLETVGKWPWPRRTLAAIVDEVRLAGADALSLDIVLSDRTRRDTGQSAQLATAADDAGDNDPDDAELTAAIQRFGRVLVPLAFDFEPPSGSAVGRSAAEVLRHDLELDESEVAARIPSDAKLDQDTFLGARREALAGRIRELMASGVTSRANLRQRLLPRSAAEGAATSSLSRQFDVQFDRAVAALEARRFGRPRPQGCPPLRVGRNPLILPALARVAWCSGYVDDLPSEDGVVRGLPLWVEAEGLIYPQTDLALACAVLRIDPKSLKIENDRVILPRPDGRPGEIPTRLVRARGSARIGTYFDIPWFGSPTWETMYDFPRYQEKRRHVPVVLLWGLADSRRTVARNNAAATREMRRFAGENMEKAAAFVEHPPDPADIDAWVARAAPVADEAAVAVAEVEKLLPNELTALDRDYLTSYHAIRDAVRESRRFVQAAGEVRSMLSGKVAMLGSTATAALDMRPTSIHGACPGVVIHGAAFNAILSGTFWRFAPWWVTAGVTALLGLGATAIVTWLPPWRATFGTLVVFGGYVGFNGILLFDYGDRIVGLAGPLAAIGAVWGSLTLFRFVVERSERARITRKFRGYVDPQLVEYVVQHPEISRFEGQVREMTVCFSDLVGFTTMTEQLREAAVPILGRYINRMVTTMRKHRGLLNRLMGDGIMFSYGAPLENANHAEDAVATVMEMQEQLKELNRELAEEGHPQLALRAGVSTGKVVVGDSGGTEAVDYTCIGDTTNLGARLESANKFTGTKNLISGRTAELLNGKYLLRPVALLQVVGKKISVMTYEPLAKTDQATDEQRNLVAMMQEMIDHYQAGRFEHCIAAADALDEAFGPSKLTKLYRDTCDRYIIERAPDGFVGQIVLSEK